MRCQWHQDRCVTLLDMPKLCYAGLASCVSAHQGVPCMRLAWHLAAWCHGAMTGCCQAAIWQMLSCQRLMVYGSEAGQHHDRLLREPPDP